MNKCEHEIYRMLRILELKKWLAFAHLVTIIIVITLS